MRRLGVRRCRNVATEACRSADNGAEFLARVKAETGLVMEPITPDEEVRLTVAGCAPLLLPELPHVLLFDIGGGSTEIVWAETASGRMPRVIDFISIPMGVMTVAERYGQEAMSESDRAAVAATVDAQLLPFAEKNGILDAIADGAVQMLGTSGTVTTLGGLHLGIRRYDRAKVDGIFVPFDAIAEMAQRLIALPIAERAGLPCVGAQRADLMAAGCSILEAIRGRFPGRQAAGRRPGYPRGNPGRGDDRRRGVRKAMSSGRKKGSGARGMTVRVKSAKGRKLSSTLWLKRQLNDRTYVAEAKRKGYRSRAAFKLLELDERFHFLKHGQRVDDLGAAPWRLDPGWWPNAAGLRRARAGARIVAIDRLEMDAVPRRRSPAFRLHGRCGARRAQGGAGRTGRSGAERHGGGPRPGIRRPTICGSSACWKPRWRLPREVLAPGGAFVGKVLQGGTEHQLLAEMKRDFAQVRHAKPPASRKESAELYVVAQGFRGGTENG